MTSPNALSSTICDVLYNKDRHDKTLVVNESDERLLVQALHLPIWLHCSFDWIHEPVVLEPGEERTLEFWSDPYFPHFANRSLERSQSVLLIGSSNREARVLAYDRNSNQEASLKLTVHSIASDAIARTVIILSIVLSFIGFLLFIRLMRTPLDLKNLLLFCVPVSLIYWLAWIVRRGAIRRWIENAYGRCRHAEDRDLFLKLGRIYGCICNRSHGRFIQVCCFPLLFLAVAFPFVFIYMLIDLAGWNQTLLGQTILSIGYAGFIAITLRTIYQDAYAGK